MNTSPTIRHREPSLPQPRTDSDALLIGSWHAPEFSAVIAAVDQLKTAPAVSSIDEACEFIKSREIAPVLILCAQSLPGEIRQQDVDRLQKLAALARITIVAGSWCEGELRTGHAPTGALRFYWYDLAPWWQANQRRLAAGISPTWSAPLDHPQSGRYSARRLSAELPPTAVHTDDVSVYDCLVDAGLPATWTRGTAVVGAKAGIFDGGQLSDREFDRLAHFCRQIEGPVIVLLDFPRIEHLERAKAAGATEVFAKPYILEELFAALNGGPAIADHEIIPSPHF